MNEQAIIKNLFPNKIINLLDDKRKKLGIEIDTKSAIPKKEFVIPRCKMCNLEYKENKNIPESVPEHLKQFMRYIPACDCFKKAGKINSELIEKEKIQDKIKKYKALSIIDSSFLESNFEKADMNCNYMKIAKKYAETFSKRKDEIGLFFTGSVGTGKTFASYCISNYLLGNSKSVLVINLSSYLTQIKLKWSEAEMEILDYIKKCDLLVIDDLGAENISPFVLEKTFGLIDTRYRSKKPMIITSNLDIYQIKEKFGERISDRISGMCFEINVSGESRRKLNKKAFLESLK